HGKGLLCFIPDYSYPMRETVFDRGLSGWSNGTSALPFGRARGGSVRSAKGHRGRRADRAPGRCRAGGGLASRQGPHRPLPSVILSSIPPSRAPVRHPTRRGYGLTRIGLQLRVTVTLSLSGPLPTRSRIASSPVWSGSRKNQSRPRPPLRLSAARSSWTRSLLRNA